MWVRKKNITCQWEKISQENGKTLPQSRLDIRSETERHGITKKNEEKIEQMPSRKIRICQWEKNITCQWEKNRQNKSGKWQNFASISSGC